MLVHTHILCRGTRVKNIILVLIWVVSAGVFKSAFAYEKGNWVIRAGVANTSPDASSSNVALNGGDLGFGVDVDDDTQVGLNFAYFINDKWNVEVLASTPFSHDIVVNDNPLGLGKLGDVNHLPPSITLNYFFAPSASAFQPYVGLGINATLFFDEEFTASNQALGFSNLDLDESFGITAQIGFDYVLTEQWLLNASVRYIDISTDATFTLDNPALGADGAEGAVTVDIDPLVTTVSLGYKF